MSTKEADDAGGGGGRRRRQTTPKEKNTVEEAKADWQATDAKEKADELAGAEEKEDAGGGGCQVKDVD